MNSYEKVIGTIVHGRIDRPAGSRHPDFPNTVYSVNYGHIDGVFAGDGEEQDVYIFGEDKPLEAFEGRVIAIYHRLNDVEDKWIVSVDERNYTDEEILQAISFQEKYFKGILIR